MDRIGALNPPPQAESPNAAPRTQWEELDLTVHHSVNPVELVEGLASIRFKDLPLALERLSSQLDHAVVHNLTRSSLEHTHRALTNLHRSLTEDYQQRTQWVQRLRAKKQQASLKTLKDILLRTQQALEVRQTAAESTRSIFINPIELKKHLETTPYSKLDDEIKHITAAFNDSALSHLPHRVVFEIYKVLLDFNQKLGVTHKHTNINASLRELIKHARIAAFSLLAVDEDPNLCLPENDEEYGGLTLAQYAFTQSKFTVLEHLVSRGAYFNPIEPISPPSPFAGWTLLQFLADKSEDDSGQSMLAATAELLIEDVNPNAQLPSTHPSYPELPIVLYLALKHEWETVNYFLHYGADAKVQLAGQSLMQLAMSNAVEIADLDIDIIPRLLDATNEANGVLPDGQNYLSFLAEKSLDDLVRIFLQKGGRPDSTFPIDHETYPGWTLAQYYAWHNEGHMVRLLAESGADLTTQFPESFESYQGLRLIDWAAFEGGVDWVIPLFSEDLMLESDTVLPPKHPYAGLNMAEYAAIRGDLHSIERLYGVGINMDAENPNKAVLMECIKNQKKEVVDYLLETVRLDLTCPPQTQGYEGWPLTLHLLREGHCEWLAQLIKRGADPNIRFPDNDPQYAGRSMAEFALANYNANTHLILKLLIEHRITLNETLIGLALITANAEITKALLDNHYAINIHLSLTITGTTTQLPLIRGVFESDFQKLLLLRSHIENTNQNDFGFSYLLYLALSEAPKARWMTPIFLSKIDLQNMSYPPERLISPISLDLAFRVPPSAAEPVERFDTPLAEVRQQFDAICRAAFPNPDETFPLPDVRFEPFTGAEIIGTISAFLDSVEQRQPVIGTPPQGTPEFESFYNRLENTLRLLRTQLINEAQDTDLKRAALGLLVEGYQFCGTRRLNNSSLALNLLVPNQPQSANTELIKVLHHLRSQLFTSLMPKSIVYDERGNGFHYTDVHVYNGYMQALGVELGIVDSAENYLDHLAPPVQGPWAVSVLFNSYYNSQTIIDKVYQAAQEAHERAHQAYVDSLQRGKSKNLATSTFNISLILDLLAAHAPKTRVSTRLKELEAVRNQITLTPEEAAERDQLTESKLRKKEFSQIRLNQLNQKHARGALTEDQWATYQKLIEEDATEKEEYHNQIFAEDGCPTRLAIWYVLLATGILTYRPIPGISPPPLLSAVDTEPPSAIAD
ncbi:MAG: ankyrin repeat domain-containing protein [Myxococcota bacterium]